MTTTPILTESQLEAIALMADGMSQRETSKRLGCNRATINRWAQREDFSVALQAEVERRQEHKKERLQDAANTAIDEAVSSLQAQLAEYHEAVVNVQKMRLIRGKAIMDKAYRRLKDLPDEAIGSKDLPALLAQGDRMLQAGLETWGDAIAVGELLQRLNSDEV